MGPPLHRLLRRGWRSALRRLRDSPIQVAYSRHYDLELTSAAWDPLRARRVGSGWRLGGEARHAGHADQKQGHKGVKALGEEGLREGKWVLLDYGDVIVHVFLEPVREYYDIERLWIDAPRLDLDAETGEDEPR